MINPNFNYTENPGGGIAFAYTRQKTALEPYNQNFKIWTDSAFINLSFDSMAVLVRGLFEEMILSDMYKAIAAKVSSTDFTSTVIRTDVETNTISFSIHLTSLLDEELDLVKFFVYLEDDGYDYDSDTVETKANVAEVNVFNLNVTGLEELVNDAVARFDVKKKALAKDHKNALIRWYIPASHGGLKDFNFQLKKDWVLEQENYPWIKSDLKTYYQSFKNSRSQILVLYGPPGTGKTSFIRDLICEMNLNSIISYDLKVITSDMTFVRYLSDKNFDAIIIEDADELLTSGRGDYNKIISKILNVSDGLIKLPRKKLIFTTNLDKLTDLDPAIIRPGRCFDVVEFRPYTQEEAHVMAAKLGVTLSDEDRARKNMTLAEIYAIKELNESKDPMTTNHSIKKKAFGFI